MTDVPAHLEQKYVPRLKEQFRKFADMSAALDMDPSLLDEPSFVSQLTGFPVEMGMLFEEFAKDGGSEKDWNKLAPAVHYGKYGPY